MKQEQVIELAKQAKVIDQKATMDSEYVRDVIADLSAFASLVEQATLERAAQRLDMVEEEEPGEKWQPGTPSEVIRKFAKDTQ